MKRHKLNRTQGKGKRGMNHRPKKITKGRHHS